LEDLESARDGKPLDGAWSRAQATPGGTIRLRQYQRHVMARVEQRGERALSECRGASEDEAQEGAERP
jgi:hypothetical protein